LRRAKGWLRIIGVKLYLIRHATASDIAPSDAERELTKEGREESRILGVALLKAGTKPEQILSSPLARARQTAEIIARELNFQNEVAIFDELCNGCSLANLLRAVKTFEPVREVILVGHNPSLTEHLAELIGSDNPVALSMGKGSVACVELAALRPGQGELRWFLRQKQLRLLV
jgi:phosphohistidine phosphatase